MTFFKNDDDGDDDDDVDGDDDGDDVDDDDGDEDDNENSSLNLIRRRETGKELLNICICVFMAMQLKNKLEKEL